MPAASIAPESLPGAELLAEPVQPEAAITFWGWKAALPYDAVKRLEEGARERAFYVAGLTEHDAVQAVKDAMQAALENGETLADFKARCLDVIESQGWHDSRIETIFRNNMQTAYSAGRYAKMREVKRFRPYWQYFIVEDGRARPSHAVLNNLVFHADHDFWRDNYPPNGHRCRCGVRTLSASQVEREGLGIQTEMPGDSQYTDPATGMEYHVARPGADDGWGGNPGRGWLDGIDLGKYKDITPQTYAEQRLRPEPVSTFSELGEGVKQKCGHFVRNSNGITRVEMTHGNYFLATNSTGSISVSDRAFKTEKGNFLPVAHLKSAWNKIAKGEKLDWLEEYSMEGLWHEIVHNRQKYGAIGGKSAVNRQIMEIVTQWSARRTYPSFLEALGGTASHLESIKREGLGYSHFIRNFDRLLGALKVDEAAMLREMTRLIDTIPRDSYQKELSAFLSTHSGIKKSVLNKALVWTKYGDESFEFGLRQLGIIE